MSVREYMNKILRENLPVGGEEIFVILMIKQNEVLRFQFSSNIDKLYKIKEMWIREHDPNISKEELDLYIGSDQTYQFPGGTIDIIYGNVSDLSA